MFDRGLCAFSYVRGGRLFVHACDLTPTDRQTLTLAARGRAAETRGVSESITKTKRRNRRRDDPGVEGKQAKVRRAI
jgi:hypothetical protein